MSNWTDAQGPLTRKFRKNDDEQVAVEGQHHRPGEPRPYLSLSAGRGGYLWIGSDDKGCYTHIPLSTLKRLIASAERP